MSVCVCEGGGGCGVVTEGELTDCGEEGGEVGRVGRGDGESRVMRWSGVREGKTTSYRIPMIYF